MSMQELEQLKDQARTSYAKGDLEQAIYLYQDLMVKLPTDPQIPHVLGIIHLDKENPKESINWFEKAIALDPKQPNFYNNLGLAYLNNAQYPESIKACQTAIKLQPNYASAYFNLGHALMSSELYEQAIECYESVLKIEPEALDALFPLGIAAYNAEQFELSQESFLKLVHHNPNDIEALYELATLSELFDDYEQASNYAQRILNLNPQFPPASVLLARIFNKQKKYTLALEQCINALNIEPNHPEALAEKAFALQNSNRAEEAIRIYDELIKTQGPNPKLLFCLANAHFANNNLSDTKQINDSVDKAIDLYQKILQDYGENAEIYFNLGNAYFNQGKLNEAITQFEKATHCPDYMPDIEVSYGFSLINIPKIEEGMVHFKRVKEKLFDGKRKPQQSKIGLFHIKHDLEQMFYLKEKQLIKDEHTQYIDMLNTLWEKNKNDRPLNDIIDLSEVEKNIIFPNLESIIFEAKGEQIPEGVLNPELDFEAIQDKYNASYPEVVVVDNFLTPKALDKMREYCLQSTVWKVSYFNGYLGAMTNQGFSFPLLFQLAYELRVKFPRIYKDHLLYHSWGFKYDSTMNGIAMHADFAAVNINFWITPSSGCLDQNSGGLLIWDKIAPNDWAFQDYNNNTPKIMDFLEKENANCIKVPYRENRIIMFNSALFHKTDTINFKDDYESRRINVTLLYGQGLKMS